MQCCSILQGVICSPVVKLNLKASRFVHGSKQISYQALSKALEVNASPSKLE